MRSDETMNKLGQVARGVVALDEEGGLQALENRRLQEILSACAAAGFLPAGEYLSGGLRTDSWGNDFAVSCVGNADGRLFTMISPGPNGRFEGRMSDDICLELVFDDSGVRKAVIYADYVSVDLMKSWDNGVENDGRTRPIEPRRVGSEGGSDRERGQNGSGDNGRELKRELKGTGVK